MKMTTILVAALAMSALAHASETPAHDYNCIASSLQAMNSDIYSNLAPSEIEAILADSGDMRHSVVQQVTDRCDRKAAALNCDGKLEANVVAKVKNIEFFPGEAGNIEHMTYALGDFSFFEPNPRCPLDRKVAEKAVFWTQEYQSVREGQEIRGTLMLDLMTNQYFILK